MASDGKKQVPLRLSPKLYAAIAAWAEDDFRSVNGQIEYLLTECVRQRKKNGKYVSDEIDVPPELDIKSKGKRPDRFIEPVGPFFFALWRFRCAQVDFRHQLLADDGQHLLQLGALLRGEPLPHPLGDHMDIVVADVIVVPVLLGYL